MLNLEEIRRYYPEHLQKFERFMLREYLQYKILELIFESNRENKLAFLGGTCLRIVYNSNRFSEDLDFDNFNLTKKDFEIITGHVQAGLKLLGYQTEIHNVYKGAYHCYIRFPEVLYREGMTRHKEEKILIRLDSEPHEFKYKPDLPLLNKFDVFTQIKTTPKDVLLAQKFYTLINRKKNKGRDFYDIVFLMGMDQTPNYNYLELKLGITSSGELRDKVIDKCDQLSMQEMADDVKPFLFNPKDEKKILLFPEYIKQAKLS